jgi:hypothetical protein
MVLGLCVLRFLVPAVATDAQPANIGTATASVHCRIDNPLPSNHACESLMGSGGGEGIDLASSKYFYFAQAADSNLPEVIATRRDIVSWTPEERCCVQKMAEDVLKAVPDLVVKASAGGKIMLCRSDSLGKFTQNSILGGSSEVTESTPSAIVFSKEFFSNECKYKDFVHELVHLADAGSLVAYSPEWIALTQPLIHAAWIRLRGMDADDLSRSLALVSKTENSLRRYFYQDLNEALAECTASFIVGEDFDIRSKFQSTILPLLLNRTSDSLRWSALLKKGHQERIARHFAAAMVAYKAAARIYPSAPLPYYYMGITLKREHRLDEALLCTRRALESFKKTGVQVTERDFFMCKELEADLLGKVGDFDSSFELIEESRRMFRDFPWMRSWSIYDDHKWILPPQISGSYSSLLFERRAE